MPELPLRPAPDGVTIILQRRPKSGFVNYPLFFQRRMVDGRARFMTKCDMLIGPCACGYTHYECEDWVGELLAVYNCRVEPLILWGGELASRGLVVEIPGYWKQIRNWEYPQCDVLVGKCVCGRTHGADTSRVRKLLKRHHAVILNMPPQEPKAKSKKRKLKKAQTSDEFLHCDISEEDTETGPRRLTDREVEDYLRDEMGNTILLPTTMERNIESVTSGCDCSSCSRLQIDTRRLLAREWVEAAIQANNTRETNSSWGASHCNDVGQIPGWCNCASCLLMRLGERDQQPRSGASALPRLVPRMPTNRGELGEVSVTFSRNISSASDRQSEDRMHRRIADPAQRANLAEYQNLQMGSFLNSRPSPGPHQ